MAVFTALSDEDVDTFLGRYGLPSPSRRVPLEGGVTNSNWKLEFDSRAPLVLTLVEPDMASKELDYIFAFQRHLAATGIAVAVPRVDKSGAVFSTIEGKPAVISSFLPGDIARQPDPEKSAQAGDLLARMHLAAGDFTGRRSNPMSILDMHTIVAGLDPVAIDEAVPDLALELAGAFRHAIEDWPGGLPSRAIHCDLFPDNVLFDANELSGAIDFFFACNAPLAYDLAMTHAAWCFSEGEPQFVEANSQSMLEAYEAVRPLSKSERDALPFLARAACLRILSTRLRDWIAPRDNAQVTAKHPAEFAARLRFYSSREGASALA